MLDIFFVRFIVSNLVVATVVIGLLVLLSYKLRLRRLAGGLIVPVASGVLVGLCNPLVLASSMAVFMILEGDFSRLLPTLCDALLPLPHSLSDLLSFFSFLGAPAAILGIIVGVMVYAGVFLWRGTTRSRLRTVLGLVLILLGWLVVGLGLVFEIFFLANVVQ